MRFAAEPTDQFKARYELPVAWTATGTVKIDAGGNLTAGAAGEGAVTCTAGGLSATVPVRVVKADEINLAARRPVQTSSGDGEKAVDGDVRSRWESEQSDPQWIVVDLEGPHEIRKVVVTWENAAARSYRVEVSEDGAAWKTVATIEDGRAGVRESVLKPTRGRYVRIMGLTRTTRYGYSIFEIEVGGMALSR